MISNNFGISSFIDSAMVGAGCVLTDSLLHGEFVITPIKFFLFNLYYNVSSHYGTHPW